MSNLASELPVELLRRIFSLLPDIPPPTPHSWKKKKAEHALAPPLPPSITTIPDQVASRGWINAAFICRSWRAAALGMKRTVPMRLAPRLSNKDLRIGASRVFTSLPVVLYIEQRDLDGTTFGHGHPLYPRDWDWSQDRPIGPMSAPMLRMTKALGERVKGVYVFMADYSKRHWRPAPVSITKGLAQFFQFSIESLPSLDELHLIAPARNHRHGPSSTPYTVDGALDIPDSLLRGRRLRVLELRDCHVTSPETFFAHTDLRELALVASTDAWPLPFATNLKQLEYLCLTLESIPKQSTIRHLGRVQLPSLKHLHLGGYMYNVGALLPKLSFPASTTIVLRCEYNAHSLTDPICPIVTPLAEHLEGSCARSEGFTDVTLRIKKLEIEIVCSMPISCRSGSLLSPSTSITVSLACRLRRGPSQLVNNYTTAIFEDLAVGICTRLPHSSAGEQTLEVTAPSPEVLHPTYHYWIDAASSLRNITDLRLDNHTARHLLDRVKECRALTAEVPFAHLRRITIVPMPPPYIEPKDISRYLYEELSKHGTGVVLLRGDVRLP